MLKESLLLDINDYKDYRTFDEEDSTINNSINNSTSINDNNSTSINNNSLFTNTNNLFTSSSTNKYISNNHYNKPHYQSFQSTSTSSFYHFNILTYLQKYRLFYAWWCLTQLSLLISIFAVSFQMISNPYQTFDIDFNDDLLNIISKNISNIQQIISIASGIKFLICILQWSLTYERFYSTISLYNTLVGKPNLRFIRQPWFPYSYLLSYLIRRAICAFQVCCIMLKYSSYLNNTSIIHGVNHLSYAADIILLIECSIDFLFVVWVVLHILSFYICVLLSFKFIKPFEFAVSIFYNNPLTPLNILSFHYVSFLYFLNINVSLSPSAHCIPTYSELVEFFNQYQELFVRLTYLANIPILDNGEMLGLHLKEDSEEKLSEDDKIKNFSYYRHVLESLSALPPYLIQSSVADRLFFNLTSDPVFPTVVNYINSLGKEEFAALSPLVLTEIMVRRYSNVAEMSLSSLFPFSALFETKEQFSELVAYITTNDTESFEVVKEKVFSTISSLYRAPDENFHINSPLSLERNTSISFRSMIDSHVEAVLGFGQNLKYYGRKFTLFVAWISHFHIMFFLEGLVHLIVFMASITDLFNANGIVALIQLVLSGAGAYYNLQPIIFPSRCYVKSPFEEACAFENDDTSLLRESLIMSGGGAIASALVGRQHFSPSTSKNINLDSIENFIAYEENFYTTPTIATSSIDSSGNLPAPKLKTIRTFNPNRPEFDPFNSCILIILNFNYFLVHNNVPNFDGYPLFWSNDSISMDQIKYSTGNSYGLIVDNETDKVYSCFGRFISGLKNFLTTGFVPSFLVRCSPPVLTPVFNANNTPRNENSHMAVNQDSINYPFPSLSESLKSSFFALPLMMLYPSNLSFNNDKSDYNLDTANSQNEPFAFTVPLNDYIRQIVLTQVLLALFYSLVNRSMIYPIGDLEFNVIACTIQFFFAFKTFLFMIMFFIVLFLWMFLQLFSWNFEFSDSYNRSLYSNSLIDEVRNCFIGFPVFCDYLIYNLLPRISIFSQTAAARKVIQCASILSRWPTFEEVDKFSRLSLRSNELSPHSTLADVSISSRSIGTPISEDFFYGYKICPITLHHPWMEPAVKGKLNRSFEKLLDYLSSPKEKGALPTLDDVTSTDFIINNMEMLFVSNLYRGAVGRNSQFTVALAKYMA